MRGAKGVDCPPTILLVSHQGTNTDDGVVNVLWELIPYCLANLVIGFAA